MSCNEQLPGEKCATCAHFTSKAPAGKMPGGVGLDHIKCDKPRIDKNVTRWVKPDNWCDGWEKKIDKKKTAQQKA